MTGYWPVVAVLALLVPVWGWWLDRRAVAAAVPDCWCGELHDESQINWRGLARALAWSSDGLTAVADEVWPDGDNRAGGPL